MTCQDFLKWQLEVANQEYKGDLKVFQLECDLL